MVPEGWSKVRFEVVGGGVKNAIVDGPFGSNLKSEHYRDSGVPVFQSGFVTDGTFNPKRYVYVDEELFSQQYRSVARSGDILMAKIGAQAGRCAVIPDDHEEGILAGNSLKITPKPGSYDRDFILHWLGDRYDRTSLAEIKSTTAQPAISIKNLKRLWITLPPLSEQRKIADILSTWDAAIRTTEALLATARTQKRALMQQLLTGKRRFPEFEGQPWKEVRLGDVTNIIVSNVDKKSKDGELPVRLCNYMDVYKRDEIDPSQSFMEATATPVQVKKFGLKVGDVIITKDSEKADDIAMPTYVAEVADDLVCGYHLAIVRPGSQVDGRFLKHYFELPHTRYYFGTRANGAIRFGLTIDGIEQAVLNLPPIEEQRRVATVIGQTEAEVASFAADLTKLRIEKKALMQQLLTGKRRVVV